MYCIDSCQGLSNLKTKLSFLFDLVLFKLSIRFRILYDFFDWIKHCEYTIKKSRDLQIARCSFLFP